MHQAKRQEERGRGGQDHWNKIPEEGQGIKCD